MDEPVQGRRAFQKAAQGQVFVSQIHGVVSRIFSIFLFSQPSICWFGVLRTAVDRPPQGDRRDERRGRQYRGCCEGIGAEDLRTKQGRVKVSDREWINAYL